MLAHFYLADDPSLVKVIKRKEDWTETGEEMIAVFFGGGGGGGVGGTLILNQLNVTCCVYC